MEFKSKVYMIGICGGSASGKTTLANKIAERFPGKVPIISQDWFYLPVEPSLGSTHNWDDPKSFNMPLILETIRGWKSGIPQWTPRHDYTNYSQINNVELIDPAKVMIFEGIHAFENTEILQLLDLKIFIECDADTALSRRIIRDVNNYEYDLQLVLDRYVQFVKPAFERWIEPTKKYADIIIYNNNNTGINPISINMIESHIEKIFKH